MTDRLQALCARIDNTIAYLEGALNRTQHRAVTDTFGQLEWSGNTGHVLPRTERRATTNTPTLHRLEWSGQGCILGVH
jgi:hypothetical protein